MRTGEKILVSIVIPCRNEEKFIGKCIDSIIANDFPKDELEVIVVDGMSEDRTREIVHQYSAKYPFIKLSDNHKRIVPSGLNIGIQVAAGEIIMRMDAHNEYAKDYIRKCVFYLDKYNADNVGGIWITNPGKETTVAKSIALALSHPFGVGNAHYRIGTKEPRYVDTVPFGCYKREIFDKIGFFDEELIRNQDDEFNLRLIKQGGKILLVPEIISNYYARDSLSKLWNMYFQYGYFKPLVMRKIGRIFTWRQMIPLIFVSGLLASGLLSFIFPLFLYVFAGILFSYIFINVGLSTYITIKYAKEALFLMILPLTFSIIHFAYGFGYLKGLLRFVLLSKYMQKEISDLPLTR